MSERESEAREKERKRTK